MNIYYHLSHYISHKVAGIDYIDAIKSIGYEIVNEITDADIIIIHDDPLNYKNILEKFHAQSTKKIIAYSVWETDILPSQYIEPLKAVDEIWTCTHFSSISFKKHFSNVRIVPHIVRDKTTNKADIDKIKKLLSHSKDFFYFYTVVDSVNPRKNLKLLLEIFLNTFKNEKNVFLVVKQYRKPWDISSLPRVISIENNLSAGEMAALHATCDCFVSLHHAEAWGLSISDAMNAEKPVIATGYSGNMHYMDETNSYPVRYSLRNVPKAMCELIPLYTEEMLWAEPDPHHTAYLMKKVVRKREVNRVAQNAKTSMRSFSQENVASVIRSRLNAVTPVSRRDSMGQ